MTTTRPATLDAAALRAGFPLLQRTQHGRRLVYLDSAATSQKPRPVLDAMDAYYREANANVHRGVYQLAAEATDRFEAARDAVAALVNAPREGCVFTRNATEAINLVAWAWGSRTLKPGDEVVVTEMEHHSNVVPWHIVGRITGATVRFCPVTPGGELDLDAMRGLIGPRTRLVGVVHVSNVLGTINPVAEVVRVAREAGATSAWWTRRRACPTCRSTCRRWAPTWWCSPATRCAGPRASACWWPGPSSCGPGSPSWAAGR